METKLIALAIILSSCSAPEIPEPAKTPDYVKSYTIQVQPNGITNYPKYIPFLKGK
jgi:hypothetical protein